MLVLSRMPGERVMVKHIDSGDVVWVGVSEIRGGNKVRMTFADDMKFEIHREEVHQAIELQNARRLRLDEGHNREDET